MLLQNAIAHIIIIKTFIFGWKIPFFLKIKITFFQQILFSSALTLNVPNNHFQKPLFKFSMQNFELQFSRI